MIKLSALNKDYYTTGQAGRMLNLNPKTPYFWALRNEVKHIVIEGTKNRFLIPEDEVIRLLRKTGCFWKMNREKTCFTQESPVMVRQKTVIWKDRSSWFWSRPLHIL